jgi:hypothetical protein
MDNILENYKSINLLQQTKYKQIANYKYPIINAMVFVTKRTSF